MYLYFMYFNVSIHTIHLILLCALCLRYVLIKARNLPDSFCFGMAIDLIQLNMISKDGENSTHYSLNYK